MFKIQTLNTISSIGLNQFPRDLYEIASEVTHPDAILLRSYSLHHQNIASSVKVIGRAGAGLNNIPIETLTKRGIPVFNTPGANANAVRELVIAGMLLASRNIPQALQFVRGLESTDSELHPMIEQNKKQFSGFELMGKTMGIIGLGNIGVKVANAALSLGMRVIGYDPLITVNRAWELSAMVKKAPSIDDLLMESDFVSFHVPLIPETQNMINSSRIHLLKKGMVLLNFARSGIIHDDALLNALNDKKIFAYVTDFPAVSLKDHPQVICLPHLGASTKEAEENCALMIAKQVRDYLEHGSIVNAVNFPNLEVPPLNSGIRMAIVNANIPNMVAQISSILATAQINIMSLFNQSKDNIAYTVIDISSNISETIRKQIESINGILQFRCIDKAG